ncbi:MAG TPA: hypothetical protein VNH39_13495 [Steroidobacteraceae bacterium]|nr:hypothetical protein [Steroidobacteraceae bacterium]
MTRKPQRWRVVFRRLQQMSPKLHRGILGPNPAADLHTIGPTQPGPARLPDGAGHRRSQPAANVANGVRRRSSTIFVNRVCVEATIEFDFLIGGNRKCALVSRNAVPEIFDKLDALVHGQLLQLRFHHSVPFFSTPLGYAAAARVTLCISAEFPEFGIRCKTDSDSQSGLTLFHLPLASNHFETIRRAFQLSGFRGAAVRAVIDAGVKQLAPVNRSRAPKTGGLQRI